MVFLREMSRSWCSTKGRCLHIVLLWMSSGAGGTRLERQELPVIMNGECLPAGRPPLCQNSVQHFRHEPTHNTDEGTPYLCQDLSVKELPGLECRCPTAPTTPARHAEDAPLSHTHTWPSAQGPSFVPLFSQLQYLIPRPSQHQGIFGQMKKVHVKPSYSAHLSLPRATIITILHHTFKMQSLAQLGEPRPDLGIHASTERLNP